jgi:hypothetical protein
VRLTSVFDHLFCVSSASGDKNTRFVLKFDFVISFLVFCIFLDLFETWARTYATGVLSDFVCTIRPYVSLADIAFSRSLIDFAADECRQGNPQEPTFLIVFFMFKLTLAVTLGFIAITYARARSHFQIPQKGLDKLQKRGGLLKSMKTLMLFILGFIALFMEAFWHLSIWGEPSRFVHLQDLPIHPTEDFMSMLLLFLAMMVTGWVYSVSVFLITNKKTTD